MGFEYYLKTRCKCHVGLPQEAPFGSSQVKSSTRCCAVAAGAADTWWWWSWSGNPGILTLGYQQEKPLGHAHVSLSAGSCSSLVQKHCKKEPVGAPINLTVLMSDTSLGRTCQDGLSPRGSQKIQPNSWNSPQFSECSESSSGCVPVNDLSVLFHGLAFSLFLLPLVTSEMPYLHLPSSPLLGRSYWGV